MTAYKQLTPAEYSGLNGLWQQCFGDTDEYMAYYWDWKMKKNCVASERTVNLKRPHGILFIRRFRIFVEN